MIRNDGSALNGLHSLHMMLRMLAFLSGADGRVDDVGWLLAHATTWSNTPLSSYG